MLRYDFNEWGLNMGQSASVDIDGYPSLGDDFPGIPSADEARVERPASPYPRLDQGFTGVPPTDDPLSVPPTGSSATSSVALSGLNRIDALRYGIKWGSGGAGSAAAIDVSFPGYGAAWDNPYGNNEPNLSFSPLSASQEVAASKALALWADVANIDFTEISETSTNVGDIRFANSSAPSTAWAYYPGAYPEAGDVWFGPNYDFNSSQDGTYSFYGFVHELGHAIGLKHPHQGSPLLPSGEDWVGNTVMSYNIGSGFLPSTPMLYDIAAAQYIYGANMTTRAGNTAYQWAPGEQIFETIWDAGGIDTIDWSNQSSAAEINLAAGSWSEMGPSNSFGLDTLAIAYNVTIENAFGGAGSDRLYGNSIANELRGNAGNDLMYGGAGNDLVGGYAGNDTAYGEAGIDRLNGGTGNDYLDGGSENDTLSGREGLDQLWGRTGNDLFDYDMVVDSRPGVTLRDVINDFVGVGAAVGDRVDLNTLDANTAVGGNQNFTFRGTSAFSAPGQVRVMTSGADTLIQANVTGTGGAELEILAKDGAALATQWVAGDFIL